MFDLDPWIERQTEPAFQLPLNDGAFYLFPHFLSTDQANLLFQDLERDTPWRSDRVRVFGKWYDQPRLTAFYSKIQSSYGYSGIQMDPLPFDPRLKGLVERLTQTTAVQFNCVLLNLYRGGADSNGWHSDDEPELGPDPFIASISLGEKRVFQLKHKRDKDQSYKLTLPHGSLLLMKSGSQLNWKHQIPKTKKRVGPRINLTFRTLLTEEQ